MEQRLGSVEEVFRAAEELETELARIGATQEAEAIRVVLRGFHTTSTEALGEVRKAVSGASSVQGLGSRYQQLGENILAECSRLMQLS